MKVCRCLVGAVIVALGWTSVTVGGQSSLPRQIITAPGSLTSQQRREIDAYVRACIETLLDPDSSDHQVAKAQKDLINPVRDPDATSEFAFSYATKVASKLKDVLESEQRLIVRLNAMIVGAALAESLNTVSSKTVLSDSHMLGLIEVGLRDRGAPVRYWAGKSVAEHTSYQNIAKDDQHTLQGALRDAAMNETWPPALQQCFIGLDKLTIAGTDTVVLKVLNQRIEILAAQPDQPLTGEHEGLRGLYVKLVQQADAGKPISKKMKKELAQVAYRFMALSADAMDRGAVGADNQADHKKMMILAETVLGWVAGPDVKPPGSLKNSVDRGDWPVVMVRVHAWFTALTNKFGLKADELRISAAE